MKSGPFFFALGLSVGLASGMTIVVRAQAEPKISLPKTPSEIGRPVPVVRQSPGVDLGRQGLTCDFICSAVRPRRSIVQVSWPEFPSSVAPESLRLDLSSTHQGLQRGNFGMIRLRAIAEFRGGAIGEIDIETFRRRIEPVFLSPVVNNVVVARDPRLPSARALIQLGDPDKASMPDAARDALTFDRENGSPGQIMFLLHGTDTKRSVLRRIVTGEGMQPGLSYRLRLIHEHNGVAGVLGEEVCRVPVCPADYVD